MNFSRFEEWDKLLLFLVMGLSTVLLFEPNIGFFLHNSGNSVVDTSLKALAVGLFLFIVYYPTLFLQGLLTGFIKKR